jgi:hypothetical protein
MRGPCFAFTDLDLNAHQLPILDLLLLYLGQQLVAGVLHLGKPIFVCLAHDIQACLSSPQLEPLLLRMVALQAHEIEKVM